MKTIYNIVFYGFAFYVLFFLIPREERRIKKETILPMNDVSLVDNNGDGLVDVVWRPVPSGRDQIFSLIKADTPTKVEQEYFTKHVKQKQ